MWYKKKLLDHWNNFFSKYVRTIFETKYEPVLFFELTENDGVISKVSKLGKNEVTTKGQKMHFKWQWGKKNHSSCINNRIAGKFVSHMHIDHSFVVLKWTVLWFYSLDSKRNKNDFFKKNANCKMFSDHQRFIADSTMYLQSHGILLPKLFWPTVRKFFANSRPSASNLKSFSRSLEQFIQTVNSERSEQFLTCSWRFLISNKLEKFEFKLEKNIGI